MRVTLALGLVLAAFTLVPGAAGLVPMPAQVCVPACEVPSHTTAGFLPAATFVASGATVTWSAIDTAHTATDRTDLCFNARYFVGRTAATTFVVQDGALFAADAGAELNECPAASALPDGSFVLPYTCLYHPNMDGVLVVK